MLSSELPKLNGTTKDLINNGTWFLFAIDYATIPSAKYCLAADKLYYLDSQGSIISVSAMTPIGLTLENPIKFEDLPLPEILPNFIVA